MKAFADLARAVDASWPPGAATDALPAMACRVLADARIAAQFDIGEFGRWLAASPLPPQHTLSEAFGQPAVTVHHDARYRIDVLFWHSATTGIHSHGFAGAFTVLHGSSFHTRYRFAETERIDDVLSVGEVSRLSAELLRKGDVREIPCGPALVHSLFHLDSPSVTLVVRTPELRDEFELLPPSIALDPSKRRPEDVKQLQFLQMLVETRQPQYEETALRIVNEAGPAAALQVLRHVRAHRHDVHGSILASVARRYPRWSDAFAAAVEDEWRRMALATRRRSVRDPELRLLLALLISLESRDEIDAVLAAIGDDQDPDVLLADWTMRLAAAADIGIPDDEFVGAVFRLLVSARTDEEICTALLDHQDTGATRQMLLELCSRLRAMPTVKAMIR